MKYKYIVEEGNPYVVQMPEMEKPDYDRYERTAYVEKLIAYNKHIASRLKYPLSKLMEEWTGRKDLIEGEDFKLRFYVCVNKITGEYECTPNSEHCNNYCNQNPKAGKMKDSPKSIAIPILPNKATEQRKVSEIFNEPPAPEDLIIKECEKILKEISHRYSIECNTTITRGQVNKIDTLLGQIYRLNNL